MKDGKRENLCSSGSRPIFRRRNGFLPKKFSAIRWKRRPTRSNLMSRRLLPKQSTPKRTSLHKRKKNPTSFSFWRTILEKAFNWNMYLAPTYFKTYSRLSPFATIFIFATVSDIVFKFKSKLNKL